MSGFDEEVLVMILQYPNFWNDLMMSQSVWREMFAWLLHIYYIVNFSSRKQQNESAEEEQELSEVFIKTLGYTGRFSKFKNRETISAVRR